MIPKVNSGDRLKIRAQDWNAIADHVNATSLAATAVKRHRGLYAVNGTSSDMLAGMCLKIGGPAGSLDDSFADIQALSVSIPRNGETDCILGILTDDAASGDIGRIALDGASYALFSSYDSALPYAEPDGQGKLKSAALGTIEVVYVDAATKQGIVIIGGTGGAKGGYFDIKTEKVDGQWQATIFNSGETEYSGSPTGYEISGRVIIGNHTAYMPIKALPISGQGVIYLYIEHDGTDSGYAGFTYDYVFASSVPTVGFQERKYIAPLGYMRYRNGKDATDGYKVTHTSHSRGGAIEVTGRWI